MPADTPPWTKPTSTRTDGSFSFLRFSRDPSVGRICIFTPLRARILRYFSAVRRKVLPAGPLAIEMVSGGAGRTNHQAAEIAAAVSRTTGAIVVARSRREMPSNRAMRRRDKGFLFSLGGMDSLAVAGFVSQHGECGHYRNLISCEDEVTI